MTFRVVGIFGRVRASALAAVVGLTILGVPGEAAAQQRSIRDGSRQATATRAELEEAAAAAEQIANTPSAGAGLRQQKAAEARAIRERLATGDVQAGDRIAIRIVSDQTIQDTLTVGPGGIITIPQMGQISLRGVLRSELEPKLRAEVGRFLRNVTVTATPLTRLQITGAVGRPGFFQLPSTSMLEAAIMAAGGPNGIANLRKVTIRRGDQVLWDPSSVQVAIQEGVTLQELGLRGGDEIFVGTDQGIGFLTVVQAVTVTTQILTSILFLTRRR